MNDTKSEGVLYFDEAGSGLASLYKRQLDYFGIDFGKSESVALDTLDNYVSGKGIDSIDLLKIDVEGNELNVLNGAANALSHGLIEVKQYNETMEIFSCTNFFFAKR